ncbi:MAG: hypothetical protein KJO21_09030 [Verrucomicrobiae bacterium]|nr:hypothetical protein [Verrucomicrobiae bacterium]NNJ42317.1 hypothetical protein [Akkermansiaceae bacterium]
MNHHQRFQPNHQHLLALWALLAMITLGLTQAHAQVAVRMQMNKSNYILNEPVSATVYITNHAGRELILKGNNQRAWLNFHLTASGRVIPTARSINYKAVVIPAGQTVARTISLSSTYSLGNMGNYVCTASVNMPGPTRNGFSSNRSRFTITNGRTAWLQRAGVPNAPGEIREYKLLTFSANRSMELFAQVSSANNGRNIATIPLGKILTFRKPTGTLDRVNNMHAIYQVKPNFFTHTCISPSGKIISIDHHKRGATGDPRLITFGNGEVRVAGSIPYNPSAEAAQRKKIHNISERPPFVYR